MTLPTLPTLPRAARGERTPAPGVGDPVPAGDAPERWVRRVLLAFLVVMIAAALAGLFGPRSATASATGGGFTLDVTYASIGRAGMPAPVEIRVATEDGSPLPSEVTVAITTRYLGLYDDGVTPSPQPEQARDDGTRTLWTFATVEQRHETVILLDGDLDSAWQLGDGGTVEVVADDGATAVAVDIETKVAP